MKKPIFLPGLLLCSFPAAMAQETSVPAPPLHSSAKEVGIEWKSRSSHYEVDSPPLFPGEKAFEMKSPPSNLQGRFVTMACPGGDGKGHAFGVWGLKNLNTDANGKIQVSSTFYNGETGWAFYAPLFSPNGKQVVGRFGLPPDDIRNAFEMVVWDLSTGKISRPKFYSVQEMDKGEPHPKTASYFNPGVSWSRGSRFLSFVRGGNSIGGYFDRLGAYSPDGYELWICDLKAGGFARRLAVNVGLSWSWTHHATVLWSRVTADGNDALRRRLGRPSIYESGVNGGAPRKLFDGGYFAQESPDGQWIAFADWPGFLLGQSKPTPQQQAQNAKVQPGIYLFHRPTGKRVFAGAFPAAPPLSVQLQWTPDSRRLFVFNTQEKTGGLEGVLYRMDIEQQQLKRLAALPVERPLGTTNNATNSWFSFRGTSSDGARLYANTTQLMSDGPPEFINDRHTLWSIDAQSGAFSAMASLTDIANENPDWDFRDAGGQNPALVGAEKLENALPGAIKRKTSAPKRAPNSR